MRRNGTRMNTEKRGFLGIRARINERMNVARRFGGDSIMFCIAYLFWVLGGKDVHMFINLKKGGFLQGFGVGLGRNARRFAEMGVCMNIYVYIQG